MLTQAHSVRGRWVAAVVVTTLACASTGPAVPERVSLPSTVPLPGWTGAHDDRAQVPRTTETSAPAHIDGVSVAGPVSLGTPDPRWRTRTLGTPGAQGTPGTPGIPGAPDPAGDPLDALLRTHHGERTVGALHLRDAPVADTLRMLSEMGGFNLVLSDDVVDRRITLDLHDVPLAAALRAVLAAAHLGADVADGEVQVGPLQ